MSEPTAQILINLSGDVYASIAKLQSELKELVSKVSLFEGETKEAFNGLKSQSTSLKNSLKQISFSSLVDNVRNVADAMRGLNQPGLDFQQQIADLSAITGISGAELDVLSEAARRVGKDSGLGASQAAEAFKLLASNIDIATIGGVEGLKKLQEITITLSQAAGVDLPMAADTMSFALNQFQLPVSEAARMINVLGAGAKYGAAEIPDLAAALKDAGSVAHQAGQSIETTTGAIEVLSQRGLKGSEAGNALRNVLLILQNTTLPGVHLKTQGLSGALKSMQKYMGDSALMAKLFGRENINAAQILISSADAVTEMTNRVTGTQVAYEQAAIRTNTYQHELDKLKAKLTEFKIKIFESTGALAPWTEILLQGATGLSQLVPLFWLTNNAVKALRASQIALNMAQYAMPILAIVAGLAMLGVAIYELTRKYDGASIAAHDFEDAQLEAKKRTVDEKFETERLIKTVQDITLGTMKRAHALEELKKRSKEYFGDLTLETAATEKGTKAMNEYVASIEQVAMAEALKDKMKEHYKNVLDLQENGANDFESFVSNAWAAMRSFGGINRAITSAALSEINITQKKIGAEKKAITIEEKQLYNIENPKTDQYNNSLPFGTSPSGYAPGDKRFSFGNKVTVGDIKIEIHTEKLEQSAGKIKEFIKDTILAPLKDTSLFPTAI